MDGEGWGNNLRKGKKLNYVTEYVKKVFHRQIYLYENGSLDHVNIYKLRE